MKHTIQSNSTCVSNNLYIVYVLQLFEIPKETLPALPTAKLNRETAITKNPKVIAELRQQTCFGKIQWQEEANS